MKNQQLVTAAIFSLVLGRYGCAVEDEDEDLIEVRDWEDVEGDGDGA